MEEINKNVENPNVSDKKNENTVVVTHSKEWKNNLTIVLTIIMTVLTIASIILSILFHNDNIRREELAEAKTAQNQLIEKQKSAIPNLHVVHNQNAFAVLDLYDTPTDLNGKSYMHFEDFCFQNLLDNTVQFSHVEYNNQAYQIKDDLVAFQGQVIQFSPEIKFEVKNLDAKLYIVVKTIYGQYFSYECNMIQSTVSTYHECWVVKSIKDPVAYDTNNEVFRKMNRNHDQLHVII